MDPCQADPDNKEFMKSMKDLLGRAPNNVSKTDSEDEFASIFSALHGMPKEAYGDPKAAAEFGKDAATAAGESQKAEAASASGSFDSAQRTYRKLADKAETVEERAQIREDVRRAEERADSAARHRVESNERIWKTAFKTVGVVAVGAAGLGLAGVAYALSKK